MKYSDVGFRAVYHNFCVFPLTDAVRGALEGFPGASVAEAALLYGYYDREAGITLEVLAGAIRGEKGWRFGDTAEDIRSFIRIDAVQDVDFAVLQEPDKALAKRYAKKLRILKGYDPSKEIEMSREMRFLDESRHPVYIDDVQVILAKEGLKPECCWARMTDVSERRLWAKLLNEPDQDFGIHEGEDFTFYVYKDEESGKITCHAQFSPFEKIDPAILEDGSLLKEAVRKFHEGDQTDGLFEILQILRDSYVWIPCNAALSEEDTKAFLDMIREAGDDLDSLKGRNLCNSEKIRMIPDILQREGQFYFPVFSTEEDMGEYGEGFSKIHRPFMEAIALARNNRDHEGGLTGIVINPFTAPFVLPKELFEAVEKMVSRVE